MLPILQIISVGGVLLAITLFLLALKPPGDVRARFARLEPPARGPLIDRHAHPEWRQLRLLAAVRRAEELQALRALSDTPAPEPAAAKPAPKPAARPLPDKEVTALLTGEAGGALVVTGSLTATPEAATIPVDIGEASSTKLPVRPHEELPPVISAPQSLDESALAPQAAKPAAKQLPAKQVAALLTSEAVGAPAVTVLFAATPNVATISVEAGEASPTEPPAQTAEPAPHKATQAMLEPLLVSVPLPRPRPTQVKPARRASHIRRVRRTRKRAGASAKPAAEEVDLFQVLFGTQQDTDKPKAKTRARRAAPKIAAHR